MVFDASCQCIPSVSDMERNQNKIAINKLQPLKKWSNMSDGDHVLTLARYVYAQLLVSIGIIFKISENRFLNVTTLILPAAAIFA